MCCVTLFGAGEHLTVSGFIMHLVLVALVMSLAVFISRKRVDSKEQERSENCGGS
jgi:hypothetical protein